MEICICDVKKLARSSGEEKNVISVGVELFAVHYQIDNR